MAVAGPAGGGRRERRLLRSGRAAPGPEESAINHADPARLLLSGPAFVLLFTGCLSLLSGLCALLGRAALLADLAERAGSRLEHGRVVPTLWGLAASLLILLLSAALVNIRPVALLGVVTLLAGLTLASLGLAAAALPLGRRLLDASAASDAEALPALRLGLWTLLLSSAVPFAGWLLALLVLASGVGAVLEVLLTRPGPRHPEEG